MANQRKKGLKLIGAYMTEEMALALRARAQARRTSVAMILREAADRLVKAEQTQTTVKATNEEQQKAA